VSCAPRVNTPPGFKSNPISRKNAYGSPSPAYSACGVSGYSKGTNLNLQSSYLSSLPLAKGPSFTRSYAEHKSWGAAIDPKTKDVSFKLFSFADNRSVDVKIFDEDDPSKFELYPMKHKGGGVYQTEEPVSADKAHPPMRYSFVITKKDGTIEEVKDPYAMRQGNGTSEDFLKYSILYDHSAFEWKNQKSWMYSDKRITRDPGEYGLSVRDASIYEIHIDTLTKEGTYEAAKKKLKDIKALGFNTIELMPQENTFSFNWGYDGVDKFAPTEHRGGPDKLKELIDYAHGLELNVIMDYVPNHLGPDGAQLNRTGPYVTGPNAFGEGFNFEGENSRYVRDYIVNAGLNWIDNYKVDGLRLDMTKLMESDFTMKQIAAEINHHFPSVFLIAEDARGCVNTNGFDFWDDGNELHDKRVVKSLKRDESFAWGSNSEHCKFIEKIDSSAGKPLDQASRRLLSNLGYDSEWDFSYHHALQDAIYLHNNMNHLMNTIYQSQHAVKYVTSHDETGNNDGTRPVVKYLVPRLNLNSNIRLNEDDLKRAEEYAELKGKSEEEAKYIVTCQKAQAACEKLVHLYVSGKLDSYTRKSDGEFYNDILAPLDITKGARINYRRFVRNYKKSMDQCRMAQALTYAIPGPKMVFQGEEDLDTSSFRFFRQFESPREEPYLYTEKGYEPGRAALEASKLGSIETSHVSASCARKFNKLISDLNRLNRENPALTRGWLAMKPDGTRDCVVHNDTIGINIKDDKTRNEFFVVSNFKNDSYPSDNNYGYNIQFPKGKWIEVLNTDDPKYGGTGRHSNAGIVIEGAGLDDENEKVPIYLAEYSTIYFKRVL